MTIPNTKESQRVLAEEIAKQVADNSGWKSITSNYTRIYQAAFLGVVKTCERLAAASQSNAEFHIDNETILPGGGRLTNLCREVVYEEQCSYQPDADVLVEIDEGRP